MKRFLFVMTAIAILASSTLCVSADYEVDADGFTTINNYENPNIADDRDYGIVIVKGADAVLDLSTPEKINASVMYINQATAKAGALSFGSIGLKLDGEFEGATAFIGGEGFGTATKIGNLVLATEPEDPPVTVVYGDVNSSGTVTNTDSVTLARYLAEWDDYPESVINMANADVNSSGTVTNTDSVTLARYLAEWDGYETLPVAASN